MYLLVLGICILLAIILSAGFVFLKKITIGKKNKITNKQGIDEEVILDIDGIKQYLYIRGQDKDKPIILFLHGGPGTSMVSLLHVYQYSWEGDYVVVNYDQRSANMSYSLNKDNWKEVCKSINTENLFNDTKQVIDYLLKRFNKEKIIVMGHSWGSFLGINLAKAYPEKISAFVGVGQVLNYKKSLRKVALYIQEKIEDESYEDKNEIQSVIDKLDNSKVLGMDILEKLIKLQEKYLEQTGHNDILLMIKYGISSPYMKLKDLLYYANAGKYNKSLYNDVFNCDVYKYGKEYKIPVILVSGEYDYISSCDTNAFLEYINAPYKDNLSINKSGHICMMDNPDDFYEKVSGSLRKAIV